MADAPADRTGFGIVEAIAAKADRWVADEDVVEDRGVLIGDLLAGEIRCGEWGVEDTMIPEQPDPAAGRNLTAGKRWL